MHQYTKKTLTIQGKEYIIEIGKLAKQAESSVWIQCEGTVVLVTLCLQKTTTAQSFLPLTVEYTEKMYAMGKIPGNYAKREVGRPSDREILIARLIDRPIRPFFPKEYSYETQIIATTLSSDQENNPDVLAMTGASIAIMLSSAPFEAPVAGVRIGRINDTFCVNPTQSQLEHSDFNIVLAASSDAIVMVEGEANFLPERELLSALSFAHEALQPFLDIQRELQQEVGKEKIILPQKTSYPHIEQYVQEQTSSALAHALSIPEKLQRKKAKKDVRDHCFQDIQAKFAEQIAEDAAILVEAESYFDSLEKRIVRDNIVHKGIRIDGRDTKTVRPISIETGLLPRTHGSALFTRGETQSLATTTLGASSDELRIESLVGESTKHFMLHYNFPPFCVGEVRNPKISRREIGHGNLAERALAPILPNKDSFPYTVRVVTETLESNGSSSMAAVCSGVLSLMDAGVPIKTPVAGVAMGLIKEEESYYILTDILGDEDALGDMDFKIAGNQEGITAIQMDIKIKGLPPAILETAIEQAREARIHILSQMTQHLRSHRPALSEYAPQHKCITVPQSSISAIIGSGGKNIKNIIAQTNATIDIDDSGKVTIFAPNTTSLERTITLIREYSEGPTVGQNYEATIKKILDVGVVVALTPVWEAFVHISQLSEKRIESIDAIFTLNQKLTVKVTEIANDKIRASHKAVLLEEKGIPWQPTPSKKK